MTASTAMAGTAQTHKTPQWGIVKSANQASHNLETWINFSSSWRPSE
jgi:hypothetical protein